MPMTARRPKLLRMVVLVREDELQAVRDAAHDERKTMSDIVRDALREHFDLEDAEPIVRGGLREDE